MGSVLDTLFGYLVPISHPCDYVQKAPKMRVMSSGEDGKTGVLVIGADGQLTWKRCKPTQGVREEGYNYFQDCQKSTDSPLSA